MDAKMKAWILERIHADLRRVTKSECNLTPEEARRLADRNKREIYRLAAELEYYASQPEDEVQDSEGAP